MASWRDQILKEFTPQIKSLTLVADPDSLLTEEDLRQEIQARGFEIIAFEDSITFRFAYESKHRDPPRAATLHDRQQRGELTDLVIVVTPPHELCSLPYDLLQASRQLSFSLKDLFPSLSYPLVNALERSDLDALYQAQAQYPSQELGENATKDFVLRHVFDIALELIKQASDLLLILLRRHYRGQRLPAVLDERFIQLLRDRRYQDWPLETIITDRQAFFSFLQSRWPRFVRRQLTKSKPAAEPTGTYVTSTLADLPFDHEDVRVYIDNLFLEGHLQPISLDSGVSTSNLGLNNWVTVGLNLDPASDRQRRLERLIQSIDASIPSPNTRYQNWLTFAHTWAELVVLWHEVKMSEPLGTSLDAQSSRVQVLQEKVDTAFLTWVMQRYGGLYSQPALKPVMLHQIPRFLARELEGQAKQKLALLVLDGLALNQWLVLQDLLAKQRPQLRFRSEAVFAWLPTITSVSRQAVFAGKSPIYFPDSIHKTDKEALLWTQFWADLGLSSIEVAYAKGLGEDGSLKEVEEILSHPKVRVVGLVIDKVDKIMHGMELGTAGMHNQVRQWATGGFTADFK